MKSFAPVSVISALFLASSALAQRTTITLPWADGNTIVASLTTDALGDTITQTLSIVAATGLVTTTPLTTVPTTTTRRLATTTATTATTAADDGDDPVTTTDADGRPLTTTGPRVVGQQETMAPMKTTTYWYDPGNGVWTVATWTASVTAEPTEATYIPVQGTIANYDQYQSEVNKNVFASAQAAADKGGSAAVSTGAAGRRAGAGVAVWSGAVLGAIGAGAAMVL